MELLKSLDDTLKDLRATIKDLDPVTKYDNYSWWQTF
jgi:hypothetical protein